MIDRNDPARHICLDCGHDTWRTRRRDYYMVHDRIWAQTGLGKDDGQLCVACLEKRIGRQLTCADLTDAPINYHLWAMLPKEH